MQGVLLMVAMCLSVIAQAVYAQTPAVAAILSHDTEPYRQVLQGVRQAFANQHLDVTLDVKVMDGEPDAAGFEVSDKTKAILTLGSRATDYAIKHYKNIPLCAGLVIDSVQLKAAPNATALVMTFPLETELEWLARFIGDNRTIAVLYDPNRNQAELQQLRQLASQKKQLLFELPVGDPAELTDALERMPNTVSAIWSFTEAGILNAQTAKPLLLYSFRNRVPLVGLSEQWTKAGALYALDRDYVDIGVQCGEKLLQVLNNKPIKQIPIESPRKVLYSINLKTVQHMKLDVPDGLLRGAHATY